MTNSIGEREIASSFPGEGRMVRERAIDLVGSLERLRVHDGDGVEPRLVVVRLDAP